MENIEIAFDLAIFFCVASIIYGLFTMISTQINISKIRKEYLTDTVIEEIKKQNLENINQLEKKLRVESMIYIDSYFNKFNNRLGERIKRIIEDKK